MRSRGNIRRGGGLPSRAPNLASLRELLLDRLDAREHLYFGVVVQRQGDSSHFEKTSGQDGVDILVQVDLFPEQIPAVCRLASFAGTGQGDGLWKIPEPGTEVVVAVPGGEIEAGPIIVGCLSSQNVPSELDKTTMVLKNADGDIKIVSGGTTVNVLKDGNVEITTASGKTVNLNGSSYSGIKFDGSFESDLAQLMIGLLAGTQGGPTAQQLVSAQAAINTLLTNLQGGTYRSQKVKIG